MEFMPAISSNQVWAASSSTGCRESLDEKHRTALEDIAQITSNFKKH